MLKWKGLKKGGGKPPILYADASDLGSCRDENQDSYCIIKGKNFGFLAVADGMGGKPGGALASSVAIQALAQRMVSCGELNEEYLSKVFQEANQRILLEAARSTRLAGMGSTMVGLGFQGTDIYLANIGDSRAYRFRDGVLQQLSSDHTVVAELLKSGTISTEQAINNPMAHMLSRALGSASNSEVECFKIEEPAQAGDIYLLCSDGLHCQVSDDEITKILLRYDCQEAVSQLIELANEQGGGDNVTALAAVLTDAFRKVKTVEAGEMEIKGRRTLINCAQLLPEKTTEELDWQALDYGPEASIEEPPLPEKSYWRISSALSIVLLFLLGAGAGVWWTEARLGPYQKKSGSLQLTDLADQVPQSAPKFRVTFNEIAKALSLPYTDDSVSLPYPDALEGDGLSVDHPGPDPGLSKEELEEELKKIRSRIDLETRKLALWYERRRLFAAGPDRGLAAAVAVTSETVSQNRKKYEEANQLYLQEAEALLYNPADPEQEKEVNKLAAERDESLKVLNQSVRVAIEAAVGRSLQHILDLVIQRDQTIKHLRTRS